MNKKEKEYTAGTYITKKPRKKRLGKMCPVCTRCSDRDYCKHRKNIKLMQKCENCKTCSDKDNCDVFYIGEQHRITIPVGTDEETGKTIRKTFSGKTESEAIYNAEKYKKDVENGTVKPKVKTTIHSIVSIIEDYENHKNNSGITNDNSYLTNMHTLNRIKVNSWAFIPIRKVKKEQVEKFLIEEREAGKSNSVLKKDTRMLKKAFDIAKYHNYISNNFFEGPYGIMTPRSIKKDKKTQAFTPNENLTLFFFFFTHDVSHKNEFLLCFHAGMRIGEVLALSADDVDFENNIIHITKTTTLDKKGHIKIGLCPKTSNGDRDVIITELTKPVLEDAIKNRYPSKYNLLFCKPDGGIYTDSALNSCLKRICEKAGITSRVHNHKLRKNFTTRGVEAGVDYKVLEENAGHGDIHITLDTYTDAQKEFQEKELQKYVENVKSMLGDLITPKNDDEYQIEP